MSKDFTVFSSKRDTKPKMDKLVRDVIIPELEAELGNVNIGKRKDWTPQEDATIRAYYGRITNRKLARYLKVHVQTLNRRVDVLGF